MARKTSATGVGDRCKECACPIFWAHDGSGRTVAIDKQTTTAGDVELREDAGELYSYRTEAGSGRYCAHVCRRRDPALDDHETLVARALKEATKLELAAVSNHPRWSRALMVVVLAREVRDLQQQLSSGKA
jgi:hypothetical protein